MVSRLTKTQFFNRLRTEADSHRPPPVVSWDRLMFPTSKAECDDWKAFVWKTQLFDKFCDKCYG